MINSGEVLVTGSGSGLGKHCCEYFDGIGFSRQSDLAALIDEAQHKPFRAIIHSAFNTRSDIPHPELYSYLADTTLLTQQLLKIPHHKFIFISSIDVYPKNHDNFHTESDIINMRNVHDLYAISKLFSESVVQQEAKNFLILRPSALLGPYAKPNSLIKILTQQNSVLSLASDSEFNYVRHHDVASFLAKAISQDLTGIYNLAAKENIKLGEIADYFKREVNFGKYVYKTGKINNQKAAEISPAAQQTSLENILLFLEELKM